MNIFELPRVEFLESCKVVGRGRDVEGVNAGSSIGKTHFCESESDALIRAGDFGAS